MVLGGGVTALALLLVVMWRIHRPMTAAPA